MFGGNVSITGKEGSAELRRIKAHEIQESQWFSILDSIASLAVLFLYNA